MYRSLDPDRIIATIERLCRRIDERFPRASLGKVARELLRLATESKAEVIALARPNFALRIGVWLLAGAGVMFVIVPTFRVNWQIRAGSELVQTLDATFESIFFLGAAILFLVTLESRIKRNRALGMIHQLRSLAHVVDMHQLTKDPDKLLRTAPPTDSSPSRPMTEAEMQRYLDYASEMVALVSKVGALYAQGSADPVVLGAVDQVETMTTGLSRKIWQKITIIDQILLAERRAKESPRFRVLAPGTSGARRRQTRRAT